MTAVTDVRPAADHFRTGLLFALSSAFAFGLSGPLGKSLMEAGWSPTAAVTARLAGGAVAMAVFATVMNRNWLREALGHWKTVVAYGVVPIAGAQLCYYNAVSHLSVGVALLIEYTAPVLVVGWLWATTRRRPTNLTLAGVVLAVAGIMLVLDVFSDAHVNLVGVGWALVAAVCAACYFMMSDTVSTDPTEEGALNPITLAAAGLIVGAVAVALLGASHVLPMTFTANDTVVAGLTTSWIVPVAAMALIPTAIAYTLGIMGVARLRPRFASLVGLSEVMFAVLAAWVLLGEALAPIQVVGAAVVLAGLVLARQGDRTERLVAANPNM
ncbi:EamA family transporter [Mycobacterium hodleri]|uniref:EamA family transporter n=1 Tax=Mycolicibacterium hodleri TaxID=49897 RepID=A0A544VR64_9MYCO|nr:EamA family transporter [Mycolicibacterium hodleri]TQR82484.1 EamA family transporter [Mycolicibacterium hodleri]